MPWKCFVWLLFSPKTLLFIVECACGNSARGDFEHLVYRLGKWSCSTIAHSVHQFTKQIIMFSEFNKVKMFWVSRQKKRARQDHASGQHCWFLLVGKLWESLLVWTGIADWEQTEKGKRENVVGTHNSSGFLAPCKVEAIDPRFDPRGMASDWLVGI